MYNIHLLGRADYAFETNAERELNDTRLMCNGSLENLRVHLYNLNLQFLGPLKGLLKFKFCFFQRNRANLG